ncbi:MAG: HAMP domain-containing sensor histidine kinase [Pseudolysinimonas sp.]|uniref:sensor histidine kinase n=1 Tax=Pseudolysinimonas sp. TaxID=2680009 RepID=UPI003265EDF2
MSNPVQASFDRWWNGISLRAKVTGVIVLLLTLGLTVAGAGTMTVLRAYLLERVDEGINSRYSNLESAVEFSGFLPYGDDRAGFTPYYFAAVSASGELLDDNLSLSETDIAPVISGLGLSSVIQLDGGITLLNAAKTTEWRVIAYPSTVSWQGHQATLLIGRNLSDTNALLGRYAAIFLLFAIAVVVFAAMATQLLVSGAFMPLRDVERTAARFAAGDYSQRLGGATPNTEVGRLSRSLNTMLARIDRAFADRARTVDQMRRFVGDASHELRTPLVSVRGYAELYRMGALQTSEDVAQAMDRIEREAIRMGALVEDLLELARLDEARPLTRVAVDLLPIARDAALDAAASAPERRITVVVPEPEETNSGIPTADSSEADAAVAAVPSAARRAGVTVGAFAFAGATLARLRFRRPARGAPVSAPTPLLPVGPIVFAEEDKIRQVVTNLMGNAMRFTRDNSPVEIVVDVDSVGGFGVIAIVDHGEGIPPQLREKIFQRFFRADSSRTRDTGGSGLGLAIVAGIVANHDGHVEVVETPGGGATFRVSLPLLPTSEPEAPSPAPAPASRGRAKRP